MEETQTEVMLEQFDESKGGNPQYQSPPHPARQTTCNSYFDSAIFTNDNGTVSIPSHVVLSLFAEEPAGTLTLYDSSKNYGKYKTESGAIEGLYLSRETFNLEEGSQDYPEEIPFSLAVASEEEWSEEVEELEAQMEEEREELEEEASGLLG